MSGECCGGEGIQSIVSSHERGVHFKAVCIQQQQQRLTGVVGLEDYHAVRAVFSEAKAANGDLLQQLCGDSTARIVGPQQQRDIRPHEPGDEQFTAEVFVPGPVIIEMVAGDIGDGRGFELQGVAAMLMQRVAADLDHAVCAAAVGHPPQQESQIFG